VTWLEWIWRQSLYVTIGKAIWRPHIWATGFLSLYIDQIIWNFAFVINVDYGELNNDICKTDTKPANVNINTWECIADDQKMWSMMMRRSEETRRGQWQKSQAGGESWVSSRIFQVPLLPLSSQLQSWTIQPLQEMLTECHSSRTIVLRNMWTKCFWYDAVCTCHNQTVAGDFRQALPLATLLLLHENQIFFNRNRISESTTCPACVFSDGLTEVFVSCQ